MELYEELLIQIVEDYIGNHFSELGLDFEQIIRERAIIILQEIKEIIQNAALDDFMKIDKIVDILSENGINSGCCHDF